MCHTHTLTEAVFSWVTEAFYFAHETTGDLAVATLESALEVHIALDT